MKKDEKDRVIGRALTRAIKETQKAEECPSPEDLSAFIDGTLDEQERDRVMGHLSRCDRCYEVFSMTHEMIKEEKQEATRVMIKKKRWIYAPIAVAAAAVLVILVKFGIQIPGEYTPPSSNQIINRLAKNTDVKSLSNSIKEDQTTVFAFISKIPLEKASFRIGVCLTDLDISLLAEDKPKSLAVIKRINSTLQSVEGSAELASFYADVSKKIEEGAPPKEFFGKNIKIEQFIEDRGILSYLRFGEWTEGGRIAAVVKNREFFDIKSNQYFIDKLEGTALPQGVFKALEEIKGVLVRNEFADSDFKHLERAFINIVEIM